MNLSIANRSIKFLIDSGSSISLINSKLVNFDEIKNAQNMYIERKIEMIGVTGHSAITTGLVKANILINGDEFKHAFYLFGNEINLSTDGILGWDFLKNFQCNINFEKSELMLKIPKMVTNEMSNDSKLESENIKDVSSQTKSKLKEQAQRKLDSSENSKPKIDEMDVNSKQTSSYTRYNPYLKTHFKKIKTYKIPNKTYVHNITTENMFDNTKIGEYIQKITSGSEGIIIPERCEHILEIDTNLEEHNHLICKNAEILPNVKIKNAVLENKNGKICLTLQNHNYFPIKLIQTDFDALTFEQTRNYTVFSFKPHEIIGPKDRFEIITDKLNLSHCSDKEKEIIKEICKNNTDCFFINGDPINHTDLIEHSIQLKPNSKPVFTKQYKLPEAHKREIQRQLEKMEAEGIIEKCAASKWNSPLLLVPKARKEGEEKQFRLVVDFRKLNEATVPIRFPIPHIDSIIDSFNGAKYFSTLDLNGAFYQIKLKEEDRQYTTFQNNYFTYHFRSMPQGLCTSPFTMQNGGNLLFNDLLDRGVKIYMDDIVIYTKTLEEHLELLQEIFTRLRKHNFKLKIEKCFFLKREFEFLGFIISEKGSLPNPNKTSCINKYPRPKNVVEIQRFLGLCNYYRKFIENFAKIAKPLYNLCGKDVPFIWNQSCENAFNNLKQAISSPPVLAFPDFNETFIVHTDASNFAVGTVLSQLEKPIQFASKTLNAAQRNYSTIEKELYAIIYALETFRHYLLGFEFILYCDHKPLIYLFNSKRHETKMYRWRLQLSDYTFKIIYKQGSQNTVADALSRIETEKPQTLDQVLRNTDSALLRVLTRSKSKELQILTKLQNENTNTNNEYSQNGTKIDSTERNPLNSYTIEENSNILLNSDDVDHIFYIFPNKNCEMRKKIEHKLKTNIKLPDEMLNCIPYSMDKNKTIFLLSINSLRMNDDERIMLVKLTLQNVLKVCVDHGYNQVAINIDIKIPKLYFEFKFITKQIFCETGIKMTFYLNKIMEVLCIEDIMSILMSYHDSPLAGHGSFEKTKNSIRRYYSWPTMNEDIKKYVKNCDICKKSKITRHTRSPMQITSTANYPFQKVYVDHVIVHKDASKHKYSAILTCICELTKYAIVMKVKNLTALTTAKKLLNHVFLKHNIPSTLVSDQGPAFTSQLLSEITKLFKIRKITTTPYRPNSNIVERFHRTLSQLLIAIVHENPETWVDNLDSAVFAYNNSINSSTGFTPHELLYGFSIKLPDKIIKNDAPIYNYENYRDEVRHNLSKNWKIAHENIDNRKEINKNQYDKKSNPLDLKVGDKVFVYNEKKEHKFGPPYDGPFTVEEILSPVTIMIKRKKKSLKVHKDKLILA